MRTDYLTWGVLLVVMGALVTWVLPGSPVDARAARATGTTDVPVTSTGFGWTDWLGYLAMLVGLGLVIAGFVSNRPVTIRRRID